MVVWADHRGPLRAALRATYGLDIARPDMPWDHLADLVAGLPPGCALWRSTGGPLAWSDETHALFAIEHGVRVLAWQHTKKGASGTDQPRPVTPPRWFGEIDAQQTAVDRRAARYLERTGRG